MALLKGIRPLATALLLALPAPPVLAGTPEYELKAAFIYQVARLIDWPESTGVQRLCILGGNPFGASLDTLRGRTISGRRLEIALIEPGADARACSILYLAPPAERHLDRVVALSRGAGLLTIGDSDGFAQRGMIVNFFLESGKVRFEINLDAARRAGLKISSRLLSLARIVE